MWGPGAGCSLVLFVLSLCTFCHQLNYFVAYSNFFPLSLPFVRRGWFAFLTIVVAHSPAFCASRIIRFGLYSNTPVVPRCMLTLVRPIQLLSFLYYDCGCTYCSKCTSDNSLHCHDCACANNKIVLSSRLYYF